METINLVILDRQIKIMGFGNGDNASLELRCNELVTEYQKDGFFLDKLSMNGHGIVFVFVKVPVEEDSDH